MDLKLWGVRGSLPTAHSPEEFSERLTELAEGYVQSAKGGTSIKEYVSGLPRWKLGGFGGQTTCLEVNSGSNKVIVDGGTGIRPLGDKLMAGPCGQGKGELHILFTHFHWDHIMGVPFFRPLYVPGNKIHIYAVQEEVKEMMHMIFRKPYFPVAYEQLGAEIHYHVIPERKPLKFGKLTATPYLVDHPDPCYGFKFEEGKKAFSFCTDTETIRKSREELGPDLPLYQNIELLIYDAQYTLDEIADKINWGHSAGPLGIDLGMREKINKILFVHHDPGATDERIIEAERETRAYYEKKIKALRENGQDAHEIDWCFVAEGYETSF